MSTARSRPAGRTGDDSVRVRRDDGIQRLPGTVFFVSRTSGSVMLDSFSRWVQEIVFQVGYPGLFVMIVSGDTLVPIPSEP